MLNKNKGDEMIKILQHLQRYIPVKEIPATASQQESASNVLQHKLLLGGDQLTVARVRGAQTAMCNGLNAVKRLEGFVPIIQDWHAKVVLLEVCYLRCITKYLYSHIYTGDLEILL